MNSRTLERVKLTVTDGFGIFRRYILISQIATKLKICHHNLSVIIFLWYFVRVLFNNALTTHSQAVPTGRPLGAIAARFLGYLLRRVVKCRNRTVLWLMGRDERPKSFNESIQLVIQLV